MVRENSVNYRHSNGHLDADLVYFHLTQPIASLPRDSVRLTETYVFI